MQNLKWKSYDKFNTSSNCSAHFSTNISVVGRKVKFTVDQYSEEFWAKRVFNAHTMNDILRKTD